MSKEKSKPVPPSSAKSLWLQEAESRFRKGQSRQIIIAYLQKKYPDLTYHNLHRTASVAAKNVTLEMQGKK